MTTQPGEVQSADPKAFHDRERAEPKRHNAALICLARRRCNVILAMLRTGESYRAGTSMTGQTALPAAARTPAKKSAPKT